MTIIIKHRGSVDKWRPLTVSCKSHSTSVRVYVFVMHRFGAELCNHHQYIHSDTSVHLYILRYVV